MTVVERCVVKLGGSLLSCSETPARLDRFLADGFENVQVNLIVGGGKIIDALRELDAVHSCCPVAMHWRCIGVLRLTLEIAAEWLPLATQILTAQDFEAHRHCRSAGIYLIAVDSFYSVDDRHALPQDWSTTSDSIAALLARKLGLRRVVLIKSCAVPEGLSIAQAAKSGIVDAALPAASQGLQIELRTLSSEDPHDRASSG